MLFFFVFKLDDDVRIDVEGEEEEELEEEDVADYGDEEEGEEIPLDLSRPAVGFFLFLNLRNTTKLKGKGIVLTHTYLFLVD